MQKPSDFTRFPMGSALQKNECEVVAHNIMVILRRTGDKFRELGWREYRKERLSDGNFTESEEAYFNQVIDYCASPATAKLFSRSWH